MQGCVPQRGADGPSAHPQPGPSPFNTAPTVETRGLALTMGVWIRRKSFDYLDTSDAVLVLC